jgi:hypothetical protein
MQQVFRLSGFFSAFPGQAQWRIGKRRLYPVHGGGSALALHEIPYQALAGAALLRKHGIFCRKNAAMSNSKYGSQYAPFSNGSRTVAGRLSSRAGNATLYSAGGLRPSPSAVFSVHSM